MKLCVFPNDPLYAYLEKGELKDNYFNPKNFFDEIHVISFTEKDVKDEVSLMFGTAKIFIYCVGKINLRNKEKNLEKILDLVKQIHPDVIRSYNPLIQGWFAAKCSEKLKIPMLLSLHTQYDQNRKIARKSNLKKYFTLKITQKQIEPYVMKNATKIILVYNIIKKYAQKYGRDDAEIIYNKIDYDRFSNAKIIEYLPQPLILSVGNLIKEKNFECIIKSMKFVDAYCLIIGSGKDFQRLQKIINKNKLEKKIIFKKSIPHNEIQDYYKSAKVFALAYDPHLEGLPMPVIEAMATGTPVVIPYQEKKFSDDLENTVMFSKRNEKDFGEKINRILSDSKIHKELSSRGQVKAREFDKDIIEDKEVKIYSQLVRTAKN